MSWARAMLHRVDRLLPPRKGGVVVLTYHLVGAGTTSPVDIDQDVFRAQLEALRESTHVRSLANAVESLAANRLPRDRTTVVLTFDDAYENFHERAWPILEQLALPVTLYAPVAFVDGTGPAPIRGTGALRPLSWRHLREVVGSPLLTVGSHSNSHVDLRRHDGSRLREEVAGSKLRLEQELGITVDSFCYPQGKASPRAEALVARWYKTAVVRGGRRLVPERWSPHRLERRPVRRDLAVSIERLVASPLWLEEWAAAHVAAWRR